MASQQGGSRGSRRGAAGRPKANSKKSRDASETLARNEELRANAWTGGNRALAALSASELEVLQPLLVDTSFESGHVLYRQHEQIEAVYFPDTAVASLLNRMKNDAVVEVGTIGNEGIVGVSLFLGVALSQSEAIIQIPGKARQISAADFATAVKQLPRLAEIVGKCTHAFMSQVAQTAACNRLHGIEQRCARWLLMTHDRVGGGDSFPLTHQFLSFMLGVRRAGVTEALGALAKSDLIKSTQGRVTILDRAGLEGAACECYAIVRIHSGEALALA